MEKLASKREQTLWSADRPLLQVVLPLQPRSATLMVSVAAVRGIKALRIQESGRWQPEKMCLKLRQGGVAILLSEKLRKEINKRLELVPIG